VNLSLYSAAELASLVGERAKERRLAGGMRQADLAEAAGVTLSTLKRFERSGAVGFEVVTRIALALGAEREFAALFPPAEARSLDEILAGNRKRLRARKKA
jgi:transcriptional regulator with XRE-family HTH domain